MGGHYHSFSHQARYYFAEVERLEYFGYIRSASLQLGVIRCGTSDLERKRNPASISLRVTSKQPTARANARLELRFTFTIGPYDDYPANQVVVKRSRKAKSPTFSQNAPSQLAEHIPIRGPENNAGPDSELYRLSSRLTPNHVSKM